MNVRVAVLASLSHICENRLHVALDASDPLVHAAQGVSRLIVIEFWDRADRPPTLRGVTVLAGNVQISVRAVRTRGFLCLRSSRKPGKGERQHSNEIKDPPPTKHGPPPEARHFTRKRQEDV